MGARAAAVGTGIFPVMATMATTKLRWARYTYGLWHLIREDGKRSICGTLWVGKPDEWCDERPPGTLWTCKRCLGSHTYRSMQEQS